MWDIDKDWIPVILGIVTPGVVGVGWWFKSRRADRLERELAQRQDKLKDLARIEILQDTIFKMQQERIADEGNKRKEADTSVKLLSDMTVLLKSIAAAAITNGAAVTNRGKE